MSELQPSDATRLVRLPVMAGQRPDGQAVVEELLAKPLDNGEFQLVKSPGFVPGLASGDCVRYDPAHSQVTLTQRSGNLSVRVYSRVSTEALEAALTPDWEKLGGSLDVANPHLLVYSIHVSCGFTAIEALLNRALGETDQAQWRYGNVYDPADGVTPLNWWQPILAER